MSDSQRQVAKAAEMAVHQGLTTLVADAGVDDSTDAHLLAGHLIAVAQDWYVKRWKYKQAKLGVDAYADSLCALAMARIDPACAPPRKPAALAVASG